MTTHPYTAIVGIDPSLTSTGMAIIGFDGRPIRTLTTVSKGKADADWGTRFSRIDRLAAAIAGHVPTGSLVLIEAPSYGSGRATNTSQHDRAGLWWLLYGRLTTLGACVVIPISPATRATYATGKGNAGKDAVLAAVVKRYPDVDITGNDVADAMVLAAIGARLIGWPIDAMPKTHTRALDKVGYDGPMYAGTPAAVGGAGVPVMTTPDDPTLF